MMLSFSEVGEYWRLRAYLKKQHPTTSVLWIKEMFYLNEKKKETQD